MSVVYFLLIITSLCSTLRANECTELCNLEGILSPTTEICATDYNTYKAPLSAILGLPPPYSCYRQCGIDVLYPGTCECPNACGSAVNRGSCKNNSCECISGWGGIDCNSVVCPNSCSGHGKCHSVNKKLDICKCDIGFTGPDCSIPTLQIPLLPYGEISANKSEPYYKDDKYGDNHPIFNISVIGNWYIEMDPEDYDYMLNPANTWNQSRSDVKAYFTNGNVHQKIDKAKIKVKGHFARLAVKKSFSLEFKEKFFHMDSLILKASALDPTYLRSQIIEEYLRAMMIPASRASFGTLTINGIFYGLFWMNEELDEKFVKARFGNDKGDFYSMNKYLNYLGNNESNYKNCEDNHIGDFPCYNKDFGRKSWSDFIQLATFLNKSSNEEFASKINSVVNVDNLIRSMVVLSAIDDPDSYTSNGNNWALYDDPDAGLWQFISKDFEKTMLNPIKNANNSVHINARAQLATRTLAIPQYQAQYMRYFGEFLQGCFSPKLQEASIKRISAFEPFLLPIIKSDEFFRIDFGITELTEGLWKVAVQELQLFLEARYISLEWQMRG